MGVIVIDNKNFHRGNKIVSHILVERQFGNYFIIQHDYLDFGFTYVIDV